MWYDGNVTLTRNCLFNFVIGGRGCGKTYWATNWAIKDFLKTGKQFVYLRRYKSELEGISEFFKKHIINGEWPDTELKVDKRNFLINGEVAGYATTLAKSSKGRTYPNVNKIVYDEFLLNSNRRFSYYLPSEVFTFLDFYETVARMEEVKVFFFANATSIANPYFMFFDLFPIQSQRYTQKDNKLIEIVKDSEFEQVKKQTLFGKLIAGTEYERYNIENEFIEDNETFIEKRDPKSDYLMTVHYMGSNYGVWVHYNKGKVWVTERYDENFARRYALTTEDHRDNTLLIKNLNRSPAFKTLLDAYKKGYLRFENQVCKDVFTNIFRRFI